MWWVCVFVFAAITIDSVLIDLFIIIYKIMMLVTSIARGSSQSILHWLSADANPLSKRLGFLFFSLFIQRSFAATASIACFYCIYGLWTWFMILCSSHCIHRKSQSNRVAGARVSSSIEWNGFAHSFISFRFIQSIANNRIRSISHLSHFVSKVERHSEL